MRCSTVTLTYDEWLNIHEAGSCCYCGITRDQYTRIMKRLEETKDNPTRYHTKAYRIYTPSWHIERVDPPIGYTKHNVVASCVFCNNVKGRLLDPDDMLLLKGNMRKKLLSIIGNS